MQTAKGGHDLIGIDWLALEIKNCETFQFNAWWKQTLEQAGTTKVPVLMYKRNHSPFRFMMYGYLPAANLV